MGFKEQEETRNIKRGGIINIYMYVGGGLS